MSSAKWLPCLSRPHCVMNMLRDGLYGEVLLYLNLELHWFRWWLVAPGGRAITSGSLPHYLRLQCVNAYPPSAAYMRQWTGSTLVQVMACRLFGAQPLPEPMLAYCQLDSWEQLSVKFKSEYCHFHSRKCIRNCRLPKWRPFCPDGKGLNKVLHKISTCTAPCFPDWFPTEPTHNVHRLKTHLYTKQTGVSPQDLVKSRSHEIGCYNDRITVKFDSHLGSAAVEVPVEFQSD